MKKYKKIKAWAVVFPKSKDIYNSLSQNLNNLRQKAIFDYEKGAEIWRDENCREEPFKPKIVPCEIILKGANKDKFL